MTVQKNTLDYWYYMKKSSYIKLLLLIKICLCASIILSGNESYASSRNIELMPKCGGAFGLCGYADRETGKIIIDRQFDRAMPFSEGYAAVSKEGLFGYINTEGAMVIKPLYDLAGPFYGGLAEIMLDGKTGVIDSHGKQVISPQFARSIPFTKNTVLVKQGTWISGHFKGREKLENLKGTFIGTGPYGLYDINDGWITKPKYDLSIFETEGQGRIWAKEHNNRDALYGLLNSSGTWDVSPKFNHVQRLMENRAIVAKDVKLEDKNTRLWGAVNEVGNNVVPIIYDHLSYWNNGFGIAKKDSQKGLLDYRGNLLAGKYFDEVQRPEENQLARVKIENEWFDISDNGKISINNQDPRDDRPIRNTREVKTKPSDLLQCEGGVQIFSSDNLWGLKGPEGNVIIQPEYRAVNCFNQGITWLPIDNLKKWCPYGPDGVMRRKPKCDTVHYPYTITHSYPEKFEDDPYENSVLWTQARLEYASGKRLEHPKWLPDGYGASSSIIKP